jgi:hypothetical protein
VVHADQAAAQDREFAAGPSDRLVDDLLHDLEIELGRVRDPEDPCFLASAQGIAAASGVRVYEEWHG